MDFEALADFAEELNFDELLSVNGGCGGGCGGGGGGSYSPSYSPSRPSSGSGNSSSSGCGGAGTSRSSSSSSGCGGNHVPTVEELIDAWNNPDNVKSREDANKCWAEKYGYDPKKGN